MKSSLLKHVEGELYFYEHVPPSVADLFPRLTGFQRTSGPDSPCSFAIERVDGVVFSHLLVSRGLTAGRLRKLMVALHRLHTCDDAPPTPAAVNLYANLAAKVRARYEEFRDVYSSLQDGVRSAAHPALLAPADALGVPDGFSTLVARLEEYEAMGRAHVAPVIHGDPVFSNALLCKDGSMRLIDMRGSHNGVLCLAGDANYDLAKVLQSLMGYDSVILNHSDEHGDAQYLEDMRAHFWLIVEELYGLTVSADDVQLLAASHVFSLIPLHDSEEHRLLFWAMFRRALAAWRRAPGHPLAIGLTDLTT